VQQSEHFSRLSLAPNLQCAALCSPSECEVSETPGSMRGWWP
jgi:hypothetical protein